MNKELNKFADFLLEFNRKINLVSRRINRNDLLHLMGESLYLAKHIKSDLIADIGSGNGLLGIPLAIAFPNKKLILIESRKKKSMFLMKTLFHMHLNNVEIKSGSVQEFFHHFKSRPLSVISRGFPNNEYLCSLVYKGRVSELALITSVDKVKKLTKNIENVVQTQYNIPSRSNLIIFKLENVSRET